MYKHLVMTNTVIIKKNFITEVLQTVDKGPGLLRGYGLFLMPKIIEIPTFIGVLWYNNSIINERNSLF